MIFQMWYGDTEKMLPIRCQEAKTNDQVSSNPSIPDAQYKFS